jgi:hypothetical protein
MKKAKIVLACAALLAGISLSWAADVNDTLIPASGTRPVALQGGDTPTTASVTCTANATAVRLVAAKTDRSRRKVCFQNQGNTTVKIGSSTVSASDLFVLGESTNSGTSPLYCTTNSGAYYCTAGLTTSNTVIVLEETASNP